MSRTAPSRGWVQFLLVAVPVLTLIGTWLALRHFRGYERLQHSRDEEDDT